MSSTQLTGGSVEYSLPSNYQNGTAGAKVTLTFGVADGAPEDEAKRMLDRASALAISQAREMVSGVPIVDMTGRPQSEGTVALARIAPVPPTPAAVIAATPAPEATGINTGPIATTAASPSEVGFGPLGSGTISTSSELTSAHGSIVAPVADTSATAASTPSASDENALGEITDADLRKHVEHHNSRLLNAAGNDALKRQQAQMQVPNVLLQYVQPPLKMYSIPPEKRAEFIGKLAALT